MGSVEGSERVECGGVEGVGKGWVICMEEMKSGGGVG